MTGYNGHPDDAAVIAVLETVIPATDGMKWEILRWDDPSGSGPALQVAEVGQDGGKNGWTYMQSDLPHGLAVCAAVERLTLAVQDGDADWIEEEAGNVRFLMTTVVH